MPDGPTIPANTPTPLRDIIAALGDYKVVGFGVQSDTPATVTDLTWDGTTNVFAEKAVATARFYRFSPKSGKITDRNTVYVYVEVKLLDRSHHRRQHQPGREGPQLALSTCEGPVRRAHYSGIP